MLDFKKWCMSNTVSGDAIYDYDQLRKLNLQS